MLLANSARISPFRRHHAGGYGSFASAATSPWDKWLKDRRRRSLSPYGDLEHYRRMAAAISRTLELMPQVDSAIAAAGLFA